MSRTLILCPPGEARKPADQINEGWSRSGGVWWRLGILLLLVLWLYSTIIVRLLAQWYRDPDFSYGFLVLVFSAFVLIRDRKQLARLPRRPSWWGLLPIVFALLLLITGVLGVELFLSRISLVFLLVGLIMFFLGQSYLRAARFPLALLTLVIPIPEIILNQITLPLQLFASKVAANILPLLGVPAFREGNIINLPRITLSIAEACSGIRSIFSLVVLAAMYAYFSTRRPLLRAALIASAVPIAVVANSLRIVFTGLLAQYWAPDKAEGFFHLFAGWLIFITSVSMLFVIYHLLAGIGKLRALAQ